MNALWVTYICLHFVSTKLLNELQINVVIDVYTKTCLVDLILACQLKINPTLN